MDAYQDRLTAMDRRRLLRPLTQTEIIDQAVRVLQLFGLRLMGASLLTSSLYYLSMVFFATFVAPTIMGAQATGFWGQAAEIAVAGLILLFNIVPLFVIGISFGTLMTSRLAAHYMMGDRSETDSIESDAFRGIFGMAATIGVALFRTMLCVFVAIAFWLVAAMLSQTFPGNVWLDLFVVLTSAFGVLSSAVIPPIVMGNVSLAPVVYAVEGVSGTVACKRSKTLLSGQGHVPSGYGNLIGSWLLVIFVGFCLYGGLSAAFGVLGIFEWSSAMRSSGRFGPLLAGIVDTLPMFVSLWIAIPLYSSILTVLYYDRRVRMEAYDIKILAQDVLRSHTGRRLV